VHAAQYIYIYLYIYMYTHTHTHTHTHTRAVLGTQRAKEGYCDKG